MRIIFMGTPEPAAKCLQALIDSQEQIVCCITQPDRKKGRGLALTPSPVKILAEKYKIPILMPEKVKDNIFIEKIKAFNPDLIIVVAYGKILPKEILDFAKFGAINVHASLLPKYRGAAPVQWAILNGETKTGITIMYLDENLDTGDIILQGQVDIAPEDNAETLLEKLFDTGASALLKAIEQIKNKTAKRMPQNNHDATYAPLIVKELGEIDWKKEAYEVNNKVRALVPWPCAHTYFAQKVLKIWESDFTSLSGAFEPGEVIIEKEKVMVACSKGALILKTVQYEGGKIISASDFARGHKLASKKILPS